MLITYTYQFTSDWCWSAMAGVLASVALIGNLLVGRGPGQ